MLYNVLFAFLVAFANSAPTKLSGNYWDNNNYIDNDGEFGDKFEGDLILSNKQKMNIEFALDSRNGLRGGMKRWPNQTVVYKIRENDFSEEDIIKILAALDDIATHSCVKFKEQEDDEHAVTIQGTANGCFSNVGFVTNTEDEEISQVLNLAKGCFTHGTIVHEMLHTLGFYHMQSTYDRDDYVKVYWENIKPGTEHNFAKYNNDTVTDFGVEYDYSSVMHYPETAFSKNGEKTIVPIKANVTIGQRDGMSPSDILKLTRMYCEKDDGEIIELD